MNVDPASVAAWAAALSAPTRATICLALLDGRAWTVGELARASEVARSTATEHVAALVEAGIVVTERAGRHVYVRLASREVAELLEDIAALTGSPRPVVSVRTAVLRDQLAYARTCYDHTAGAVGVALFDALVHDGILTIEHGVAVTEIGAQLLRERLGPDALSARSRRPLVRSCVDWTERRHHLAGHLGNVLLTAFTEWEWLRPAPASRALLLTSAGRIGLQGEFHVTLPQ